MGGSSGGSSAPTEQTVYSESLPSYVEPYFRRLLGRAESESLQGYQPYRGQRLAYFSPDELGAQAMTRGFAQAGTPQQFGQAEQILTGLSSPISSQYQAGTLGNQFQASTFDAGYDPSVRASGYTAQVPTEQYQPIGFEQNLQRFMSPFQQQVVDIQKREARRQSEMLGDQIGDRATQAGSLGGYREAILQAERERNLGQQLDDIQARGSQTAFDTALRQLGAERASDLSAAQLGLQQVGLGEQARQREEMLGQQAFQFGEQAAQQAAKLGLTAQQQEEASRQAAERFRQSAFQQDEAARQAQERFDQSAFELSQRFGQSAAQQLAGLGQAQQADALQRIGALSGVGSQQRALRQAGLDMGYEDFMRQSAFPQQQLGFFSNILRGIPVTPQRTVSTFQQQPGLFQQALGLGLGGLGLYKGFGGGG